jgi:SAM-dependent methyltransferase
VTVPSGTPRREQRLVFGEDAELYDRARPAYPEALIEAVVDLPGGDPGPGPVRAAEVGAGTGKATVAVARHGVEVTAIEPDPAMAAVLVRNADGLAVQVEPCSFEDWEPARAGYDLLYSAQAWHWVRPEVRYVKAALALRPRGGLALFWHRAHWAEGDPVRAGFEDLYRRVAPEMRDLAPGFPGVWGLRRGDPGTSIDADAAAGFDRIRRRRFAWSAVLDARGCTELLRTQSDHRLLDLDRLERLVDAVADLVDRHGGTIEIPYQAELYTALRRPG